VPTSTLATCSYNDSIADKLYGFRGMVRRDKQGSIWFSIRVNLESDKALHQTKGIKMNKEALVAMLFKRIDLEGLLVEDLLEGYLKGVLAKVVADSSNPYDDMAMAALYPPLAKAAKDAVHEAIAKLKS